MHLPPSDDTAAGAPARDAEAVTEAIRASTRAVAELRDALAAAGVTLPSLGIDLASCTRSAAPGPLVELGRCNLETARALTAALGRAALR